MIKDNRKSQHYQIFNDIRSMFYGKSDFLNGYPAATGIGTSSGGVVIDFIALKGEQHVKITPVKNPVQVDAHRYTRQVLDNNDMVQEHVRTTPKFERAKLILGDHYATLFVSGTAAIRGEQTIPENDAAVQTNITLENIGVLSGNQNLGSYGLPIPYKQKRVTLLRVYVKEASDIPSVSKMISEMHNNCPCLIMQSDICRGNLMVEIEGVIEFGY